MRRTTGLVVFVCAALFASNAWAEAAAKRNVLLLISDNQNFNDAGCLGNPVVKTPNIDKLAEQGIRFKYAFATTASCGPSRAVIFTGLYTHSNGQYGLAHGVHNSRLLPHVKTLFGLLTDAGYKTALLGKKHIYPPKGAISFQPEISGFNVTAMAKAATEFLGSVGNSPFLLAMQYVDPHPVSRDRRGWGIRQHFEGVVPVEYDPKDVMIPNYLPDRPEVRRALADYYQQISRLDQGIGWALDALRQAGKANNTLIIFTSDHGSSCPGAMANHYEPGVHVPFIVCDPSHEQRGTVNHAMITLADITPTILDWTGVQGPEYPLQGRSILPILHEEKPAGWDEVYLSHVLHAITEYYPMRTIRTRRHKLIWNINWRQEYPVPGDTLGRAIWQETIKNGYETIGPRTVRKFLFRDQVELYDLQEDPDEVINVANDPQYAGIRKELSAKLAKFLTRTNDPWFKRYTLPTVSNLR